MEFEFDHSRFANQKLSISLNGFTSPTLLVNGEPVKGKKATFEVTDDMGVPCTISLKNAFPDMVPKVIVAGEEPMTIVEPMPWYGWVLAALPLTLMFAGGAIGGGFGGMAAVGTLFVMRTEMPVLGRVGLSLLFSILAVVAYVVAATILSLLLS